MPGNEKVNQTKENLQKQSNVKDAVALLIAGLFIIALVFVGYNYFKGQESDGVISNGVNSFKERINSLWTTEETSQTEETTTENETTTTTEESANEEENSTEENNSWFSNWLNSEDENTSSTSTVAEEETSNENLEPNFTYNNDSSNEDTVTQYTSSTEALINWVANDYEEGDITGSEYTVKSGDTLYEIAEGRYGEGSQWVTILNANSSDVGFLPSGQQALIVPGQVLVLPSI
jgi:LysM repeat protein